MLRARGAGLGAEHAAMLASVLAVLGLVAVVWSTEGSESAGQASELLSAPVPDAKLLSSYPSTLRKLGEAALDEVQKMPGLGLENLGNLGQQAEFKQRGLRVARSPQLSEDPDVSSYIFSNEMGDWDGVWGPDNGYIPSPANEGCTDGVCYQDYARYARRLHPGGFRMPGQKLRQLNLQRALRSRKRALLPTSSKAVQTQQLGDISDLPDIEEDQEVKDAQSQVKDLFGPFEPLEDQLNSKSSEDQKDYAGFYRAYSAYQLPHEVSNQGPGRPWKAENLNLGGGELPPNGYPYSPAYYPAGSPKAALTINANGANSQNSFKVQGPRSINVNIGVPGPAGGAGGEGAEGPEDESYIYPDGLTTVIPAFAQPSAVTTSSGRPVVLDDKEKHQAAMVKEEEQIGEQDAQGITSNLCSVGNPDCNFWQDAYDDEYW